MPSFEVGIVHLGFGGFHRGHLARYTHELMQQNFAENAKWGILGVGLMPQDQKVRDALIPQDCLYCLVERSSANNETVSVIGSVRDILYAADDAGKETLLRTIGENSNVKVVSMTVTEHGYCLSSATKKLNLDHPSIVHDLQYPRVPWSVVGVLVEGYRRRKEYGLRPFTSLSCDNVQHNGDLLRDAVITFAACLDADLATWISTYGRFPNSMVDRITPVTSQKNIDDLRLKYGIIDNWPIFCESFSQFVVEDDFADSRPPWESVGVQFVKDVTPYEMMKLRLLNASHHAIAALGDVAGYTYMHETIGDEYICRYMRALMDRETGPTLLPVPGLDLAVYKETLISRFANPAIQDTVLRVTIDTNLIIILSTIRDLRKLGKPINLSAIYLAGWLRRLNEGPNDKGMAVINRHPPAVLLKTIAKDHIGEPESLLKYTEVFGDLGKDQDAVELITRYYQMMVENGVIGTMKALSEQLKF